MTVWYRCKGDRSIRCRQECRNAAAPIALLEAFRRGGGWRVRDGIDFSKKSLRAIFELRHGDLARAGWAVKLMDRLGYFNPDVFYETAVEQLVHEGDQWIEVGGGDAIFPSNSKLAELLTARCGRLVGVDPSDNIQSNPYVSERSQCFLEDYTTENRFDLATMRMVVEHVAKPERFVTSLAQLIKPGGAAVIYTVDRWAPVTLVSHFTPFWFHVAVKKLLWSTGEEDTFPTVYKMNTRSELRRLMESAGFEEISFVQPDDCRTLGRWKLTLWLELAIWRTLRRIGVGYPEQCLLGIYHRN